MGSRQKYCVFKSCNRSGITYSTTSYHRFPNSSGGSINWEEFVRRSDIRNSTSTNVRPYSLLCSRHFQPDSFIHLRCFRKIKNGYSPTIFVDFYGNSTSESVSREDHSHEQMDLDEVPAVASEVCMELDMESDNEKSEITRYIALIKSKDMIIACKSNEIKLLKRKLKRTTARLKKMKEIPTEPVKLLTKSTQTQSNVRDEVVPVNCPVILQEILTRSLNRSRSEYSTPVREFALQASFYSPKAYAFLRETLQKSLPHPNCFKLWTSSIDTKPGLFSATLKFLEERSRSAEQMLFYGLSFDEMNVRKQIVFDGKSMKGYTDYGTFYATPTKQKEGTNALFIMASEVNGNCRVPIGYILTNGCDSELMASVIGKSLEAITECSSKTLTITFDGLPVNLAAAEVLGANLDVTSDTKLKTFIDHPLTKERVYIFPDTCHMLKLVRNTLDAYECLVDKDGNEIRWDYFQKLVNFQNSEGLTAANKLTIRHSNFSKQKMKVRLAVPLLSSSVSIAMRVCERIGVEEFIGSSGTAKFAEIFDRIFDTLNSRRNGKGYKAPLAAWNKNIWQNLFLDSISYMRQLRRKSDNRLLINTKRKTCVVGLIICLSSLISIMEEVVLPGRTALRYLPTYKLSQDILELFFSTLRQRLGRNNNPNAVQLESALRRILAIRIKPNLRGNCVPQEDVTVQRISPLNSTSDSADYTSTIPTEECLEDFEFPPFEILSLFVSNVVTYMAGIVGRRVMKKLDCEECVLALIPTDPDTIRVRSDCILLNEKDNGGLFIPSDDVIRTCRLTEQVIRQYHVHGVQNLLKSKIVGEALRNLVQTDVFKELRNVNTNYHSTFGDHVLELLKMIAESYVTARLHYIAKQESLRISPTTLRNHLTKTVLFSGH